MGDFCYFFMNNFLDFMKLKLRPKKKKEEIWFSQYECFL